MAVSLFTIIVTLWSVFYAVPVVLDSTLGVLLSYETNYIADTPRDTHPLMVYKEYIHYYQSFRDEVVDNIVKETIQNPLTKIANKSFSSLYDAFYNGVMVTSVILVVLIFNYFKRLLFTT